MRKLLCLFLFSFLGTVSPAEAQDLDLLKSQAIGLVEQSIKNGHSSISNVDTNRLLEDIKKVKLEKMTRMRVITDGRMGGAYHPGSYRALIDPRIMLSKDVSVHPAHVLHEMVGAASYEDKNMSLTLQILFSGQKADSMKSELTRELIESRAKNPNFDAKTGSGTVVGGGGDPDITWAKIIVLEYLNYLASQGLSSYQDIPLARLVQLGVDCSFEIHEDSAPIRAKAFDKLHYRYPDGKLETAIFAYRPWGKISMNRDWLRSYPSEDIKIHLFSSLAKLAKAAPQLCDTTGLAGFMGKSD